MFCKKRGLFYVLQKKGFDAKPWILTRTVNTRFEPIPIEPPMGAMRGRGSGQRKGGGKSRGKGCGKGRR